MTATLHDRLADLAEEAPAPTADPGLWERGRRYGRRRAATTAGVGLICVALLALSGGMLWQAFDPAEPGPADSDAPTYVPDRFYEPSPWLPGTADEGPIGPLIAVIAAERKTWTSTTEGYVGVSAATGDYRFLDLPNSSDADHPVLSPDGRHVAYWLSGDPEGTPNTSDGPTVGFAVYDTVNGDVVASESFATEHGLAVDGLVWADDDTLGIFFGHWLGGDADRDDPLDEQTASASMDGFALRILRLGDSASHQLTEDVHCTSCSGGGGRIVVGGERAGEFDVIDTRTGTVARHRAVPTTYSEIRISGDGRRVSDQRVDNVFVGALGPDRTVRLREVPGVRGLMIGWRDPRHAVMLRSRKGADFVLFSAAVESGETQRISRVTTPSPRLAVGLLDSPVVDAAEPPSPMDPRGQLGLSVTAMLVALAGLVTLVRRRRG